MKTSLYPYTKNNHFQFGFLGQPAFQSKKGLNSQFTASYGAISKNINSWPECNNLAAREIYDQKVGDIIILLSGGTDSEICLRSFYDQKLPFRAVTLKYSNGENSEDIEFVNQLKTELNFKHEIIELNLERFWSSKEFYEIVEPIRCVSPILACHLWLVNQLTGTPVIAQGEALLVKKIPTDYIPGVSPYPKSEWYLEESEMFCSLYSHFIHNNKPGIPGFFQYLPEQTNAFLFHNPYLSRLINDEIPGKLSTRSSKNLMSYQFYPHLQKRDKLTGFEHIMDLQLNIRNQLVKKFPNCESKVQFSMQEMHQMLHKN